MGKLLTGEYNSRRGIAYKLEIYDRTTGTDSPDTVTIAERPTWNWAGKKNTLYQAVMPRTYSFKIHVPSSGAVKTFVDSFKVEVDEHRYWLKATRGGVEQFRGWLQIDDSVEPIRHQDNFDFTLTATDTLGKLGEYDYIDPATPDTPYTGIESVKDHLRLVLKSAHIDELYETTDNHLVTSTAYHNSEMPNTTDDFAARIFFDHRIFSGELEEKFFEVDAFHLIDVKIPLGLQPTEPGNCMDVLNRLCFQFNAMFFQSQGKYYFISRANILKASAPIWTYRKDGQLLSTGTLANTLNIGSSLVNNTGYQQFVGGDYRYQTPLKELWIDHHKGGGNNKITGAMWSVTSNNNQCFDEINNQGNATALGRFVFKSAIKYTTGTDSGWFRIHIGIKIKIGAQYLVRDTVSDIFGNGTDNPPPTQTIEYTDPVWQASVGYFEVVLDRKAGPVFNLTDESAITIVDFESPVIPASGELCVDIDLIELRKFDSFTPLFDDRWDTVTFTDADTFNRSGNVWDLFWEARDNYINIQSEDGELNEDTLAYTRFKAKINIRNSQRLEFSTDLGDDPGSNTHGRVQVDKSPLNDGSDRVDADGGWTIDGAGTVYPHMVALLAWDMARLRVSSVRKMSATHKTTNLPFEPYTKVSFDGKVSLMSYMRGDAVSEDNNGQWLSFEDVDNTQVVVTSKQYGKAAGSSPNQVTISNTPVDGNGDRRYIHSVQLSTATDEITVPAGKPLPNPDEYDEDSINDIFRKAYRGTAALFYRVTATNPSEFSIDHGANKILFFRNLSPGEKLYFVWVLPA